MAYKTIKFELEDGVALITLNRPEDANAITLELASELFDAAVRCESDKGIRAAVLTGSGKMFCAGGDLKDFHANIENIRPFVTRTATMLHQAEIRFAKMASPLIIAVNGTAAGGGFSLALSGDYVIASNKAKYVAAYTASGLTPDGSSTYNLAKHVGLLRAKELLLTNRVLTAEEAMDWGMVNRVVEGEKLMVEAMALARTFAAGPTRAFGGTKQLLNTAYSEAMEAQLEKETLSIAGSLEGRDGRHGLEAFLNKTKPEYTGE